MIIYKKVIILGNSVSGLLSDSAECGAIINTVSSNFSGPEFDSVNALKKLDETLFHICNSIFVDLMPGEFDPTNIMLPQNPMHYCMYYFMFAVFLSVQCDCYVCKF